MPVPRKCRRALVVDFDFFFHNVGMSLAPDRRPEWLLFDWCSTEIGGVDKFADPYVGSQLWRSRALSFLSNDLPLPTAEGWQTFWDRFPGLDQVPMVYCDSNQYSAPQWFLPGDGARWDRIDLYDAHHDSGYDDRPQVDCGNWMAAHRTLGTADLRVHYPQWRPAVDYTGEKAPRIRVQRRIDDAAPVRVRYDRVMVCRSGAWVPSWCDPAFAEFIALYPGPSTPHPATAPVTARGFDLAAAREEADMVKVLSTKTVRDLLKDHTRSLADKAAGVQDLLRGAA